MPNRTQVRHGPGGVVTVTSRHRSRIWCPVRSSVHTRRPPRNARAVPSLRVRIMIIAHPVIDAVLRRRFAHGTSSGDVRTNGRTSATPPRGASNRHHERDINHAAPCADVIGRRPLRETGRKRTTARARVAFLLLPLLRARRWVTGGAETHERATGAPSISWLRDGLVRCQERSTCLRDRSLLTAAALASRRLTPGGEGEREREPEDSNRRRHLSLASCTSIASTAFSVFCHSGRTLRIVLCCFPSNVPV